MKTFKKMILDDLKKQGLQAIAAKIKSIRYRSYSGGDSVDVDAVDLFKTERDQLDAILSDYKKGHFDGMTDCYEYSNRNSTKERTAKFVFLHNTFSTPVREHVEKILREQWEIVDDKTAMAKMGVWFDQSKWRLLQQLEKGEI